MSGFLVATVFIATLLLVVFISLHRITNLKGSEHHEWQYQLHEGALYLVSGAERYHWGLFYNPEPGFRFSPEKRKLCLLGFRSKATELLWVKGETTKDIFDILYTLGGLKIDNTRCKILEVIIPDRLLPQFRYLVQRLDGFGRIYSTEDIVHLKFVESECLWMSLA